jgi:Carboxypeptidase regulatory-like domain/TonB-dependent Receptor Plug Domain
MKYFLIAIFATLSGTTFAQTGVISGVVTDKASESPLAGATVKLIGNNSITVITDKAGFFKLENVPLGRQSIQITFSGFESNTIPNIDVITGKENVLNITLVETYNKLTDVVIKSSATSKQTPNNKAAAVSARQFTLEEVTRYAGGRSDVARLATNFAGVSAPDDSRNDIVVRGNSPTGLLWRIEGIPVPSPNHFSSLGTTGSPVSALNPNVLTNSDFITSAFPAEYGNALGGVFDLGFKKGNPKKREYQISVGAFPGLEALAEGPMGKNGGTFVIAARYAIAGLLGSAGGTTAPPNYSDISFNFRFAKTKIGTFSIFGIGGNAKIDLIGEKAKETDLFAFKDEDGYVKSGFGVLGLKHNINTSDNAYIRTTIGISSSFNTIDNYRYFNYQTPQQTKLTNITVDNRSGRIALSSFYNAKLNSKVNIRTGFLVENYMLKAKLSTRELQADTDGDGYPDYNSILSNDGSFTIFQPFAQGQFRLTPMLTLNAGLHGQQFSLNNQFVAEPRASLALAVTPKSTFSIGYGLHHQNISEPLLFLNENMAGTLVQTNRKLDLVQSSHYVVAYDAKLGDKWRLKLEAYYQSINKAAIEKTSSGYSSLTEGSEFIFSTDKSSLVSKGKGSNKGVELTIEKFYSKGYHVLVTSSVFESKYKGSDGMERSTPYNNNYVLNFLGGKEFKIGKAKKNIFSIDTKVTKAGGKNYTPIDLIASKNAGFQVAQVGKEFSQQYKSYFRMDIKFSFKFNSSSKKSSHQFYIDLQNITGNENPFRFQYNRRTQKIDQLNQIGFFPDFGYKFQF